MPTFKSAMLSMKDVLAGGVAVGLRNPKQQRMLQCLRWRQTFQNADHYQYEFRGSTKFSLRQIPNGEIKGLGTGTFVWPAATVLAKYFEIAFPDGLAGMRVCELGSGVGLNGVIASLLGARDVVLSDQDIIVPLLKENLEALREQCTDPALRALSVEPYDWSCSPAFPHTGDAQFDILIVSDCVLPKLYPIALLVQALERLMSDHTVAYFSYEHRPFPAYDPRQEFARLCEEVGLAVEVIPLSQHHPDYCADDIELWRVCRCPAASVNPAVAGLTCQRWGDGLDCAEFVVQGTDVHIAQRGALGVGGVLWPSSVVACKLLLRPPPALREVLTSLPSGCPIVDLGAGCGLTAVVLSRLGYAVTATDRATLVPLLEANLTANGAITAQAVAFDWTEPLDTEGLRLLGDRAARLVLCSDCLYNSVAVEALLDALTSLLRDELTVLLVNELRSALEEFLYLLRRRDDATVEVTEVEVTEEDLVLIRSAQAFVAAPPVRALIVRLTRAHSPAR